MIRQTILRFLVVCLFVPGLLIGATEADIEKIEHQLIQKEMDLLEPELKLDTYLVERSKLDGMSGWFQGKKKKEVERMIGEAEAEISRLHRDMVGLQQEIQKAVYAVAQTLEQKGDYRKAIEFYLKVENQDDKVKFRIATCYKALKEYEDAIQWFLKVSRTDQNLLEVVDCYKLDRRMKEAVYWLFNILEPINGNDAEVTALQLIETYDYPNRRTDYPDFFQRLSNVYLSRAVLFHQKNFAQARDDYRKAVSLIANGDPKAVSLEIVARYQSDVQVAMDILAQQRDAAERHYEGMLNEARSRHEHAERRYRHAQQEAEGEYVRRLGQVRQDLDRAERELERLQKQASPSAQLIDEAQRRVRQSRDQYQYVMSNRQTIIEEHVRPYRREVEEAMREYRRIVDDRPRIIENYIAPYKSNVEKARQALDIIRSLHQGAFG